MRTFSRWMPSRDEDRATPAARFAVFALGGALLALIYFYPPVLVGFGLLVLAGFIISRREDRRIRLIATERTGESICTFSRAFDRRRVDPWIIRAVYEELQRYYSGMVEHLPLRPSDRFDVELRLDGEDLEDIAKDISTRTGRLLECTEANPLKGGVHTLEDLVMFFTHQPRRQAT